MHWSIIIPVFKCDLKYRETYSIFKTADHLTLPVKALRAVY